MLGSIFASAMNCFAARYAAGESWLRGRSHCDSCGHELGFLDLVPVFSYIFLKGRCRYCHTKMSPRYLITEIILGSIFVITYLRVGLTLRLIRNLILFFILFAISLIDYDTYEIPDGLVLGGAIVWLIFAVILKENLWKGLLGGIILGGSILIISLILDKILNKESLGGGDIKLLAMVGLYSGPILGILLLFVASVVGLIFIGIGKTNKIPFGPAISIATVFTVLFGEQLLQLYLMLF